MPGCGRPSQVSTGGVGFVVAPVVSRRVDYRKQPPHRWKPGQSSQEWVQDDKDEIDEDDRGYLAGEVAVGKIEADQDPESLLHETR